MEAALLFKSVKFTKVLSKTKKNIILSLTETNFVF